MANNWYYESTEHHKARLTLCKCGKRKTDRYLSDPSIKYHHMLCQLVDGPSMLEGDRSRCNAKTHMLPVEQYQIIKDSEPDWFLAQPQCEPPDTPIPADRVQGCT